MKRFIIVGTQRTGSSAFAEILGVHPMVTCGWEWTLDVARSKKILVAEKALNGDFSVLTQADQNHIKEIHKNGKEWIGFRWLFSASCKWIVHPRFAPALWVDRLEPFINWVSHRPDIHVIHVVRENSLEWLKSVYMARKSNLYSKTRYPDGFKVRIPIWAAVNRLHAKNWVDGRLNSLNKTNPYVCIRYENFLADQKATTNIGFAFLRIAAIETNLHRLRLSRQSKGKARKYIHNYDKLRDALATKSLLDAKIAMKCISEM